MNRPRDITAIVGYQELDKLGNLFRSPSSTKNGFVRELETQVSVEFFSQGGLDEATTVYVRISQLTCCVIAEWTARHSKVDIRDLRSL